MSSAADIGAGRGELRTPDVWKRHVFAWALVAITAVLGVLWMQHLGPRNLALLFIASLMLAGYWFGVSPALSAAVIAFLAYNFFLVRPRFSFTFTPSDLLALATFLSTALLVGGMAARLRDRARSTDQRATHLAALLSTSSVLSAAASPGDVARGLVRRLKTEANSESAIWVGDELLAASDLALVDPDTHPSLQESQIEELGCEWKTLSTARGVVGTAAVWTAGDDAGVADAPWIDAILQLGSIALDRAALAAEVSDAKLIAEKEGLRTALLSSLSHDLRTPIATILASATSLSANDCRLDRAARLELVSAIEAEAERLNLYVSNLLDMTRLESGALDLKRTLVDPDEAMAAALERMRRRLNGRRILRRFEAEGAAVLADPILLEQVLVNVIENAASFSPPDSDIVAGVAVDGRDAILSVTDSGPGVPASELPRVFDKFFRGRADRARRAGVGLGLSVARGLVEAFDGRIGLESPVKNGRGTRIVIRLPMAQPVALTE